MSGQVSRANKQYDRALRNRAAAAMKLSWTPHLRRVRRRESATRPWFSCPAEHAAEDRVDVGEMKVQVEIDGKFPLAQMLADVLVGFEQGEEIAAIAPHFHGIALHQAIGVLARHALLRQRQQHALRMDQAAEQVEVLFH